MKKILLFFIAVFTAIASHAMLKEVTLDGIRYIYDTESRAAYVAKRTDGVKYVGKIYVPNSFFVDDKAYIVTKLYEKPFAGCENLTTVSLPLHVKVDELSSGEFKGCTQLQYAYFRDKETTNVPNGVFSDCTSLKELYFASENIVTYKPEAFNAKVLQDRKCKVYLSRKSFRVPTPSVIKSTMFREQSHFDPYWAEEIDGLWYVGKFGISWASVHSSLAANYDKKTVKLGGSVIKAQDGSTFGLTGVDSHAFNSNNTLEELCISYMDLDLGYYSFYNCPNLKKVVIMQDGSKVSADVFGKCHPDLKIYVAESKLDTYKFKSDWGNYYYYKLEPFTLETTVNSMTYTTYPLDDKCTLTGIESGFRGTTLTLPSVEVEAYGNTYYCSVTAIGEYAGYRNSTTIKEIDFSTSTSLKTIGMYAFRGASHLETLRLPGTIEYIDEGAFTAPAGSDPLPLKDIYCSSLTPCDINEYAFNFDATLHVPSEAAVKAYKAHPVWGKFKQVVCAEIESCGLSFMGVEITTANCDDVLGDGRVRYNAQTGWLYIKSGYYQSNNSIISVDKELLSIVVKQEDSEGSVIFDCTTSDPAIVTKTKAFILFTGIDAQIYYNGSIGFKGNAENTSMLSFYDKSHVLVSGRKDGCTPVYGFRVIRLSNTQIVKPFGGTYSATKYCIMDGDTEYSGDLEIGAKDNSAKLPLWIYGKQVTENLAADIMGDGKASYKDGTLFLNGVSWIGSGNNIIESSEELHIELSGENFLTQLDSTHNCITAPGIVIYKAEKATKSSLFAEARGDGDGSMEASAILSTGGQDVHVMNVDLVAQTKAGLFGIGATSSESILWLEAAHVEAKGVWSAIGGFSGVEMYQCSTVFKIYVYGQPKGDAGYCFIDSETGKPQNHVIITVDDIIPPYWATTEGAYEVSNITANSVHLSWNEATDNVPFGITYTIFYRDVDSEGAGELLDLGSEHEVELTGLYPNSTYGFIIKAFDLYGNESTNTLEGYFTTAKGEGEDVDPVDPEDMGTPMDPILPDLAQYSHKMMVQGAPWGVEDLSMVYLRDADGRLLQQMTMRLDADGLEAHLTDSLRTFEYEGNKMIEYMQLPEYDEDDVLHLIPLHRTTTSYYKLENGHREVVEGAWMEDGEYVVNGREEYVFDNDGRKVGYKKYFRDNLEANITYTYDVEGGCIARGLYDGSNNYKGYTRYDENGNLVAKLEWGDLTEYCFDSRNHYQGYKRYSNYDVDTKTYSSVDDRNYFEPLELYTDGSVKKMKRKLDNEVRTFSRNGYVETQTTTNGNGSEVVITRTFDDDGRLVAKTSTEKDFCAYFQYSDLYADRVLGGVTTFEEDVRPNYQEPVLWTSDKPLVACGYNMVYWGFDMGANTTYSIVPLSVLPAQTTSEGVAISLGNAGDQIVLDSKGEIYLMDKGGKKCYSASVGGIQVSSEGGKIVVKGWTPIVSNDEDEEEFDGGLAKSMRKAPEFIDLSTNEYDLYIPENVVTVNGEALGKTFVTITAGDDEDAIVNVNSGIENLPGDGRIYNLQGMQVKAPVNGQIFIIGGKKVLK